MIPTVTSSLSDPATDDDTDYDQRQYKMMLSRVQAFLAGQLSLGKTVDDLDALLNAVRRVDVPWKESFQHQWGKLEDIRAAAIDESFKGFSDAVKQRLIEAAVAVEKLIAGKVSQDN